MRIVILAVICSISLEFPVAPASADDSDSDASVLASQVTIHRDQWGVAHIMGETDEATLFGSGYAQAEDYFWQLEDNFIRGIGRYAEVHGESGLKSDLLNRSFEITARSKADFASTDAVHQRLVAAYTAGINFFLQRHPEIQPRLIQVFEPWHVLAVDRHFIADFAYGRTHVGRPDPQLKQTDASSQVNGVRPSWHELYHEPSDFEQQVRAAVGSNQWAVGPQKTRDGTALLFINPHQPWYGWGQFHEFHIHSAETLRFSGAGFFGSPVPTIGHNDVLGWTYTVNDPDIADAWTLTFDHPEDPQKYQFDGGYRDARTWTDNVRVKQGQTVEERVYEFRASHYGPIVLQAGKNQFRSVRIGRLFDLERGVQAFDMIRARNFKEWRSAASRCAIPMFNIAYADRDGNIFYVYNGAIPKRNPKFDWSRPVDGQDSRTSWQGYHTFDELPQVFNPPSGYVQNCNSTPFRTTDVGNPSKGDYPAYLAEDRNDDKRRAKRSRMLLRESNDITFADFQQMAFDTTLYWPMVEVPRFQTDWQRLASQNPDLATRVKPMLDHLADWDFRATKESTQTALCLAWYEQLYGLGYPAETLKFEFQSDRLAQLAALETAASSLNRLYGDWKIKWGDAHRLQRVHEKEGVTQAATSLSRLKKSLPVAGAPGPLGVIFTVYSTPGIPFVRPERYAIVGTCYMAVVEFSKQVRAMSITPFGSSSNPRSNHYFDQAQLFSERKFKPAWYHPTDLLEHAQASYHPGDKLPE